MAVDYGMLSRIPSVGARFAAGQEAGRAAAAQNMLLQQRAMEFQQAQEDRRLAMEERRMQREAAAAQVARRGQLAQVLRQSGMDPSDMQSATQFYAAALEANEPTAIAAAKDWLSIARETAQSRAADAEYQGIMGGAPAPTPAPMATPMAAALAPMATPMVAPAPQQLSPLAVEQAAYQRPEFYGQGQFAGTAPTAITSPVGEFPSAPPSVNAMAPAAPPVNQLAAAPAPAAAPTPAPAKDDPVALRAEAQRLEAQQQRLRQSGFKANQERAKDLDKPIERLYKQAEDVEKAAKPAEAPADLRMMDALGIPRTEAGFARFNELKQRPEAMSALSRLIAERDRLPLTDPNRRLYDDAIKKATTQVEPAKVEVKLPEQEKAFETELGKGQAKKLIDDKAVADDARSIIDTVQQGRQLLQSGMITGFGAEALTQIGAALNQAGISFASDSVANTQAFAANMAANVGRIIKQFGAGTGLSNADREYAEKMAGGKITLDRKAIERILDINERAARNVITAHNKRVAGIKTNVPLTVEMPPAMPAAPVAAPAGRPSLEQIFQPPKR